MMRCPLVELLININQSRFMSDSIIAGIATFRSGLNYLVPTKWWNQFYSQNKQTSHLEALKVPPLQLVNFVDHFLLNYQSQLVESIQEKCLYLNFHQVKINLEISQFIDWTPVNPELWKAINKKLKEKNGVLTFYSLENAMNVKETMQIQLIYCSKTRSELFVGYMPKHANLVSVIREVGFEMGFIEVTKSKITFVERSPEVCFPFHELEKYTVETAPDIFLMMFNMERKQDDEEKAPFLPQTFGPFTSNNNTLNESNQAVVGDLNTMSDDSHNHLLNEPIRNRTISTGAQTPFSFALSQGFDLDRQYRVNELFGAKEPEQIEQMKQYANKKISNHKQLISIPINSEQKYKSELERLAQQILEGFTKRKIYKDKQVQNAYQ